ncbi:ATP-binding cassette subfamily C protein CydD [Leucobacter komagatae]|uniref:ATP-binding cassette subfamily C protein CydD n=1 Tax=Leucobacter komagatae TaxID=55969 RepID=A0A542Y3X0_9MICO|nr:thiol reductant ABC exporter subunit CydD [Leucobacter komagatae]TQL42769.1 ATP-binding cassette subfamily C protein CydD [Leucobacter komagatae]
MKPFDPRLLRVAGAARSVFALGALLGVVRTVAIIAWSWFLAQAIAAVAIPVFEGLWDTAGAGRVAEGVFAPSSLPWLAAGALASAVVRALSTWGMDVVAARGAVKVKAQLRAAALDALDGRSPEATSAMPDAKLATVLGRGLDALDGYFSGYVPQLILAVVATPILVATVLFSDLLSGVTVLIVFPVIPLFMVLIGLATQSVQGKQWDQLQRLSASFLDVVEGLPTLKIFRREKRQAARITAETEEYRSRTMKVLRVTFLSGFVLDLAGTFSIALVAVTVGTRLVAGEFPLSLGLFVLLVLPEVFVPIRQVGAAFHDSTEGLAASEDVFALIEGEDPAAGAEAPVAHTVTGRAPSAETTPGLSIGNLEIRRGERLVAGPVDFDVAPGEFVALAGPSGAGKSSILAVILGFLPAAAGSATASGPIAWAGQQPGLVQGSLLDNVALGSEAPDAALARDVLARLGLGDLPLDKELGALGSGLSGGQAQRVSIARALYRATEVDADVVLLDEPSSALDTGSENLVIEAARAEARAGRAVLVVSHRPALLAAADRLVEILPPTAEPALDSERGMRL